jgi:tetratricopeptide (TPR) repeat protein
LGLKERLLAFTAFPLRPLRRHGVLRGKKLRSGLNDSFLPQSPQRKPQGSQRLELNESQVAFTTFPLRPLRHGDLNKCIELLPRHPYAYTNRAIAKDWLGDYTGAIADYNRAIELNPKEGFPYMARGDTKGRIGDMNGACLDWSKAGELGEAKAYELITKHCN